jgi:hypothetical protein
MGEESYMKYFYNEENQDGAVLTLNDFREILEEEKLDKIELREMKRDYNSPMYCNANDYFPGIGDCGSDCINYKPCNGKSGRCRFLENSFMPTGKTYILTKKGLKEAK